MDKIKAFLKQVWADPAKRKPLMGFATLLLLFILGFWAGRASAADGVLTWIAPTTCSDGTPTTNCPLTGYRVERRVGLTGTWATRVTVLPTVLTWTDLTLPVGDNYWRLYSVTANGESLPTNTVMKVVAAPLANPPGGLSVQVLTAYSVVKQVDRFVMIPVGTVPADTVCTATQNVNGYFVVPRSKVTWFGTVRPDVVVAQCG